MAKKEYTKRQWNELVKQWDRIHECQFLTLAEKFILDQIASLAVKHGYCYASNETMAEKWGCTEKNIERHIRELYRMGFIKKGYVFMQRRITIDLYMVEMRKAEKRRGSPYVPAKMKDFDRVFGEEGIPEWREHRKLHQSLKDYIGACKKNELRLQVGDVPEQVQYLIRESGGVDIEKAIALIDEAMDDERLIC